MAAAARMTTICTTTTRIDNQSRFTDFGLTCVLPDQCEIRAQTGSARQDGDRRTLRPDSDANKRLDVNAGTTAGTA